MKRIGIEINGVLRNTLKKIEQEYVKYYIDNPLISELDENENIERKVISELTSLNIKEHLSFKDNDEVYSFLYKEHPMEIFGHAGSTETNSMLLLNDFYLDYREKYDIIIVSDEIGKSKPASLFFLAKFGCLVETVKFYSESTLNQMWDSIDILLTSNPNLLLNHPEDKILIKFVSDYNKNISIEHEITSLGELTSKIEQMYGKCIE